MLAAPFLCHKLITTGNGRLRLEAGGSSNKTVRDAKSTLSADINVLANVEISPSAKAGAKVESDFFHNAAKRAKMRKPMMKKINIPFFILFFLVQTEESFRRNG
jgi:hypothetical protein